MRINLSDFGLDFRSMRIQNTIKSNRDEIKKAFTYKYALFYDEGITFYQEVKNISISVIHKPKILKS